MKHLTMDEMEELTTQRVRQLLDEVHALRRDKKRLDWLGSRRVVKMQRVERGRWGVEVDCLGSIPVDRIDREGAEQLRRALDKARGENLEDEDKEEGLRPCT